MTTEHAGHVEHAEHVLDCSACNQSAATAGFRNDSLPTGREPAESGAGFVRCASCGRRIDPGEGGAVVRVTETTTTTAAAGARLLGTGEQVLAAWRETHRREVATRLPVDELDAERTRIREVAGRLGVELPDVAAVVEAVNGQRSVNDTRALLERALDEALRKAMPERSYCYVWVCDFTDDVVVYRTGGKTWQRGFSLTPSGTVGSVAFTGDPVEVVAQEWYVPVAGGDPSMPATAADDYAITSEAAGTAGAAEVTERAEITDGVRVLEAKGTDSDGGRVFRVRIIRAGESKNGRIYPVAVLHAATQLYEGARAYDHHRTTEEMATGTIRGLIGWYSNVVAVPDGIEADLHLLPSAAHAAEALDAAIATAAEGREPLVGLSHDISAAWRQVQTPAGRRVEATAIRTVNSADVVAHPAAGGLAQRSVAGGDEIPPGETGGSTSPPDPDAAPAGDPSAANPPSDDDPAGVQPAPSTQETDVPDITLDGVLGLLGTATDEQLAVAGLARTPNTTETTTPPAPAAPTAPAVPERTVETQVFTKDSFVGRGIVREAVTDAGLADGYRDIVTKRLGATFTEADVTTAVATVKEMLVDLEKPGLIQQAASGVVVTQEAHEKKVKALDAYFARNFREGYRSFRTAYFDITGRRPVALSLEDENRTILQESFGFSQTVRSTESLDSTSWAQILGDSVARRLMAEYGLPGLDAWRLIVSSIVPVNDFRTQRIGRVGGYGTLPTVAEGQPYPALSSPPDEEATYAINKKGGTEDFTLEMLANDDNRKITDIPRKLGRAAAQTLYRFVFDMLASNITCTYDATALFHTNHANTNTSAALSQTTLTAGRVAMRDQTAYGDAVDVLGTTPRLLIVPNELEELAFQLTTSAVAVPATPAGPSNTPNIHSDLDRLVVPYFTDPNDWFLIGDKEQVPTAEIGFYQGREDPELFTQADPTVGSVFDADKFTWKIRHIYSGTWLDHRSAYRGVG